jgi:hypothetical protein
VWWIGLGRLNIKLSCGPQWYESTRWHLGSTYIQAYNLVLVFLYQYRQVAVHGFQPRDIILVIIVATVGEIHQLVLIIHKTLPVMRMETETSEIVCWRDRRTGQSAVQRNSINMMGVLDIAHCVSSMSSGWGVVGFLLCLTEPVHEYSCSHKLDDRKFEDISQIYNYIIFRNV